MLGTPGGWEGAGAHALLLLLAFVHIPLAACFGIPEFLEFGECSPITVDPDTNFERYSGIWFNLEHVPNEYSAVAACSMTNYTWLGDMMTVVERGLNVDGAKVRQNSLMRPTEGQPGVLTVDAEGVPSAPYQIVATDYDNYACVHSCMAFMGFRAAFSWVFTRVPNPDQSYLALCRDVLAEHGVDPSTMKSVTHDKDCPYMNKLDDLLTYSKSVQSKAKANDKKKNKNKKVVIKDAALPTTLEESQHVPAQEEPQHVPAQEEPQHVPTQEEPQHVPTQVPHHEATQVPQHSTSRSEDIETFIVREEEHLKDLEREVLEEEERLRQSLEAGRRLEEDEIQELRDEVIHMSRHQRRQHRTERPATTTTSAADALYLSNLVLLTTVSFLLTS